MSHTKYGCCNDGSSMEINTQPRGMPLERSVYDPLLAYTPIGVVDPCPSVCDLQLPPICGPIAPIQCAPQATCSTPVYSCAPAAPRAQQYAPYYQQPCLAPEDMRQRIVIEKLVGSFKNVAAFAMPACGAKVKVVFDKVGDVPIGGWLWSFGIGYLTIKGFNPLTGEVEVQNDCPDTLCPGQVQTAPGTPIPACSIFILQAPLCSGATSTSILNFPYLNSGFVAPANGACVDIAVTNTNGLSVNAIISLSGGEYRIGAIISGTLITICNDGGGLVAGTVVEYRDSTGTLLLPISLIQSNQCLNTPVNTGALLVCKNGTQQPLIGTQTGQVPVFNATTGEAAFVTLDVPVLTCTALTYALTVMPGVGDYVVIVTSTADFTEGQRITIGGSNFTVGTVVDGTQMHVIPGFPLFVGVVIFPQGSAVCSLPCCVALDFRVTALEGSMPENPDWAEANQVQANLASTTLLGVTGNTISTPVVTLSTTNGSATYQMGVIATFEGHFQYQYEGTAGQACEVSRIIKSSGTPGLVALPVGPLFDDMTTHAMIPVPGSPFINKDTYHISETMYFVVPPGDSFTMAIQTAVTLNGSDLATGVRVTGMSARIGLIGVAVR